MSTKNDSPFETEIEKRNDLYDINEEEVYSDDEKAFHNDPDILLNTKKRIGDHTYEMRVVKKQRISDNAGHNTNELPQSDSQFILAFTSESEKEENETGKTRTNINSQIAATPHNLTPLKISSDSTLQDRAQLL